MSVPDHRVWNVVKVVIFSDFQHFFWGLFPWIYSLMPSSCRLGWLFLSCGRHLERRCRCSVRRLSDVSIFTVPSNYGCNITSIFPPNQVHIGSFSGAVGELIIKRSASRPWCFERRGGLAVFRFAGYTHIHSHCLVLLPLMSHFLKGKPEIWGKMIWQNRQNTQNALSGNFVHSL